MRGPRLRFTHCARCGKALPPDHRQGRHCAVCTNALRCQVCRQVKTTPALVCATCYRALAPMREMRRREQSDCHEPHPDAERRIRMYAARAAETLPLFEEG